MAVWTVKFSLDRSLSRVRGANVEERCAGYWLRRTGLTWDPYQQCFLKSFQICRGFFFNVISHTDSKVLQAPNRVWFEINYVYSVIDKHPTRPPFLPVCPKQAHLLLLWRRNITLGQFRTDSGLGDGPGSVESAIKEGSSGSKPLRELLIQRRRRGPVHSFESSQRRMKQKNPPKKPKMAWIFLTVGST